MFIYEKKLQYPVKIKNTNPALAKFITALGIRHIGAQTANTLAQNFGSIEKLQNATQEDLIEIPDIGDIVAESILAYFADEDNLALLQELKDLGVKPVHQDQSALPLTGQSYIVTGTLETMGRNEAEDKLRALGATVTKSVTKTTTALIVGEKPGKSKTDKAAKLGIEVISEKDLLRLLNMV